MKKVYLWVVSWEGITGPNRFSADLLFSSRDKFVELCSYVDHDKEILLEVEVEDSYDYLDFVPDNY